MPLKWSTDGEGGGGQGCALVEPERGGPWRLTFAPGRLENVRFFIQIICYRFRALCFLQFSLEQWAQCRPQVYQLNCCLIDVKYCTFFLLYFFKLHFLLHVLGTVFFYKSMFQFPITDHSKKVQLTVIGLANTYVYRTFCCTNWQTGSAPLRPRILSFVCLL